MKRLGIALLLFATSAASVVAARVLYVQSPAAKLLPKPALNSPGVRLARGSSVREVGQEGLFYRVSAAGQTGWVAKLFVGPVPPGRRLDVGASVDRSQSVKARARASQFSQTAAARGLVESRSVRARGDASEFDFSAVEWLERREVNDADLNDFAKSGGLTAL